MIALMEREFVEKRKWITPDEFINVVAIAESTPGPIAINSATYIGYKTGKVWGSLFATLGVCVPSVVIIYTISLYFDAFLNFRPVAYAFQGIQVCVAYLILSAGIGMFKKMEKTVFNVVLFLLTTIALVLCTLFSIKVSSILFILMGAGIGLLTYFSSSVIKKEAKK